MRSSLTHRILSIRHHHTAKLRATDYQSASGLFAGNGAPLTADYSSNIDNGLLVWQISAQQDAALLAEETAFVRTLQRAAGIATKEPFIFK